MHPNDEYAAQHHQSLGKTEAWYVVEAKPGPKFESVGFQKRFLTNGCAIRQFPAKSKNYSIGGRFVREM